MANTSTIFRGLLMNLHLSGEPASLRRYSIVNHEMQMASIKANVGSSMVLLLWWSLTLNSGMVLRHMARVDNNTKITDTKEMICTQYFRKSFFLNVLYLCWKRRVWIFKQIPETFLISGTISFTKVFEVIIYFLDFCVFLNLTDNMFFSHTVLPLTTRLESW